VTLHVSDPATTAQDLAELVTGLAERPDGWRSRLRLPESGGRWWTRLTSDPCVDVWLLSWLPGQATDLHDHGGSSAAFTVVRGELTEVRLARNGGAISIPRRPGRAVTVGADVVHDVRGAGSKAAVSIHAYSPPLTRMTYYAPDGRGGVWATRTVATSEPEQQDDA